MRVMPLLVAGPLHGDSVLAQVTRHGLGALKLFHDCPPCRIGIAKIASNPAPLRTDAQFVSSPSRFRALAGKALP